MLPNRVYSTSVVCFVRYFLQEGFICGSLHKESYEEISDSTETSKKHAVVISRSPSVV